MDNIRGGRDRGSGGGRGRFFRGRFQYWKKRGTRGRGRGGGSSSESSRSGNRQDVATNNDPHDIERDLNDGGNGSDSPGPANRARGNNNRRPSRSRSSGSSGRPQPQPQRKRVDSNSSPTVNNTNSGSGSDSSNNSENERGPGQVPRKRRRRRNGRIDNMLRSQWEKKYSGYRMYFPSNPEISDLSKKLEACKEYLLRNGCGDQSNVLKIGEQEFYDLKYNDILNDEVFMESWTEFPVDIEDYSQDVLNVWGLSVHQIVVETVSRTHCENAPPSLLDENGLPILPLDESVVDVHYIRTGIMKLDPMVPFKNIKASLLGKFITIRGAIVRTGIFKPLCTRLTFECNHCLHKFIVDQPEGRYTTPRSCPGQGQLQGGSGSDDEESGCQNKKDFDPILSARTNKIVDYRKIRLQDVEHSHLEHGRIPRTVDCDMYYDLANDCNAGDVITLCGIVKMNKESSGGHADQSLHNLYIEVVAMKNHKDSDRTMGGHWFSFTNKDYYAVKEIFETEKLFRLLVASLCPSIYGHELVKAGILLSLFGGTANSVEDLARHDINILVVGDPGLGKSQILKIISEVAPRGVYVCGTGSTVAGLTVTLVREGDEYSLEAGALVMADKGVCCIDEFDKMHAQHNALLEAMEQQCISIAKAGVFRTIPARTTVIAAANPVGGHYDNTKTVSDNIKISDPLLSRFDLVFILQDRPNKVHDRSIVEHVTGFRRSQIPNQSQPRAPLSQSAIPQSQKRLIEGLKFARGEVVDLIPHQLLRKFIAYAKQYVNPKISPEAAAVLKDYYMNLRKHHRHVDATPVTTRQLESLVRLTEARAKSELREVATAEDAQEIVQIFEFCSNGVFDSDMLVTTGITQDILNASGLSSGNSSLTPGATRAMTKNMAKRLLAKFEQVANTSGQNLFSMDDIKALANSVGIDSNIDRLVTSLNNDGYLIKKGPRTYKFECG